MNLPDLVDIPLSYSKALSPARIVKHKNHSLFDHLVGTWRILRSCQCNEEVAKAGLIHSIYSTQYFHHSLHDFKERHKIQQVFGKRPESLSYLFSTIDRKDLCSQRENSPFSRKIFVKNFRTKKTEEIDKHTAEDLIKIECANYIEQCSAKNGEQLPFMAWTLSLKKKGILLYNSRISDDFRVTENDEAESIKAYKKAIESEDQCSPYFSIANKANPLAGEPLIFLAANELIKQNRIQAKSLLKNSHRLLNFWSTSWDKKILLEDWIQIIQDLYNLTERQNMITKDETTRILSKRFIQT